MKIIAAASARIHNKQAYLGAEAKDEDIVDLLDIIHLCELLLQLGLQGQNKIRSQVARIKTYK